MTLRAITCLTLLINLVIFCASEGAAVPWLDDKRGIAKDCIPEGESCSSHSLLPCCIGICVYGLCEIIVIGRK
ncbi:Hypothetical predicted protein [Paramuricea clavata]|uniref:Uncharacterized protein n=1 Tax=Paramuricea clavata TaxID=317549 RepID=A0A7D9LV32_PARCT|nr:Hypothetical predicted protein [Paramuricea clavata]